MRQVLFLLCHPYVTADGIFFKKLPFGIVDNRKDRWYNNYTIVKRKRGTPLSIVTTILIPFIDKIFEQGEHEHEEKNF